jgi:hypothetical protein
MRPHPYVTARKGVIVSVNRIAIGVIAGMAMVGCQDARQPLAPTRSVGSSGSAIVETGARNATVQSPQNAGGPAIDVSGEWESSGEYFVYLLEWAAPFFGFEPEGTRTQLRCRYTGTFTLAQTGSTSNGTYTENGVCDSAGGQVGPVVVAGEIENGTIRGQSIQYSLLELGGPPVECPQHGAIEVENGVAVRLHGSGSCIEPGHPRSPLDAPPPRAGVNRTLWEATRP